MKITLHEPYRNELEITIYRTAQELVNNALKHTDAKQIEFRMFLEKTRISLQVTDIGKGLDSNKGDDRIPEKGLEIVKKQDDCF